jgi:hypothetical protein
MRQKRWGKVKGKVTENCLMGSTFLLQPTQVMDHRTSYDSTSIQPIVKTIDNHTKDDITVLPVSLFKRYIYYS